MFHVTSSPTKAGIPFDVFDDGSTEEWTDAITRRVPIAGEGRCLRKPSGSVYMGTMFIRPSDGRIMEYHHKRIL